MPDSGQRDRRREVFSSWQKCLEAGWSCLRSAGGQQAAPDPNAAAKAGTFITKAGTFTTFDPPGSASTFPRAINPAGAITGHYIDANYVFHSFLRAPNGTFTPFDPRPAP